MDYFEDVTLDYIEDIMLDFFEDNTLECFEDSMLDCWQLEDGTLKFLKYSILSNYRDSVLDYIYCPCILVGLPSNVYFCSVC